MWAMISWFGLAGEVLESAADLAKEFRHTTEVPVSVRDSLMAQVFGQERNRPI
jgi:hypothetical protein